MRLLLPTSEVPIVVTSLEDITMTAVLDASQSALSFTTNARDSQIGRGAIADLIVTRLQTRKEQARAEYLSARVIACFVVDDLLPVELAQAIHDAFPLCENQVFKNSIRERKYIGVQMDRYAPLAEEAIFAFQDPRVLDAVR
jgi:hypothetical protein